MLRRLHGCGAADESEVDWGNVHERFKFQGVKAIARFETLCKHLIGYSFSLRFDDRVAALLQNFQRYAAKKADEDQSLDAVLLQAFEPGALGS